MRMRGACLLLLVWVASMSGMLCAQSGPVNIVFIGNSITQGVSLANPATESPCVQAGNVIKQRTGRNVVVRNHGKSGMTTFNWLAPNSGILNDAVNDAKTYDGKSGQLFVSIMLGTNDSAERGPTGSPVSPATYYDNMQGIVQYVLDKCPHAVVILQYPIWYSPNTENSSLYGQAGLNRLKSYHPIIDQLVSYFAAKHPGRVFAGSREPYTFFENKNQYFTGEDGRQGTFYLHPNATGAVKLGEFWAESILSHLTPSSLNEVPMTWTNPISTGINSGGLRDCFVFRAEGRWYLTGTSSPHWGEGYDNPGVRLYRSNSLTRWEEVGLIITNPGTSKWYASRFWAPEINYVAGRYYCTFNCRNERDGFNVRQSCGLAVADHPEGPYTVLTDDAPLCPGNDMTLFEDEDGKVYAAWCGPTPQHPDGNMMMLSELDLATLTLKNTHEIFGGGTGPVATTGWDAVGVEGPYIFKRGGIYYMTYSSWQRGYEVGYVTATDINGKWTKADNNPIFGSQSKGKWANAVEGPWGDIGHNAVFTGPDGQLWFSCHGQLRGGNGPWLVIDHLPLNADGKISNIEVSTSQQSIDGVTTGWVIEAEDASIVEGAGFGTVTGKGDESGNKAATFLTLDGTAGSYRDPYATYQFNVKEAGTYRLTIYHASNDGSRYLGIAVNDGPLQLTRVNGAGNTTSSSWDDALGTIAFNVRLRAGANTIRLRTVHRNLEVMEEKVTLNFNDDSNAPALNKLVLEKTDVVVDLPKAHFQHIEADADDAMRNSHSRSESEFTYSKAAGVDGKQGSFTVTVPETGLYLMEVVAYTGAWGQNRPITLQVNGQPSFTIMGNNGSNMRRRGIVVSMTAGANKITWTGGSPAPIMDFFEFTRIVPEGITFGSEADFSANVISEIAPVMETTATGYFTPSDEMKSYWDEGYKTSCSYDTYRRLLQLVNDPASYNLPETGYYRISSSLYPGQYIGLEGTKLLCKYKDEAAQGPATVVRLTRNSSSQYCLQIQGRYLQRASSSKPIALSTSAIYFTPAIPVFGQVALSARPAERYSYLNVRSEELGFDVVGWELASDASRFFVEDATTIRVAVPDMGYTTLYVPFPIVIPEGVKAYTGKIGDDAVILTPVQETIPASTPVVLAASPGTYTFAITGAVSAITGNELSGTFTEATPASPLTLQVVDGVPGFYASDAVVGANQAYINKADVESLPITIDDPAGIHAISSSTSQHILYNLAGQRVTNPVNGIYVEDGKKILQKR